ncbi:MAG: cupin domain-containing protein [Deltaproteobacteria bacterium]|nr:cupin domain-containing protein [Deltaproteobacteria bacterium]
MTSQIPQKLKPLVVTDLPKMVDVPGHHHPAPFWIAPDMFPGVNIRVAGLDASKMVGAPHAAPHVHDSPEIYLTPSDEKGAVLVEIQMDEEKFKVESPFAVFIPPGVHHCFTVLKCDSPHFVLGIMLPEWKQP